MFGMTIKTVQKPPTPEKIARQINFGTAVGLTRTAKEGQAAVFGALKGTFTLRGGWFQQSNKFGIKVKSAKPTDLTAEIRTNADWLEIHEQGGTKTGRGGRLAIPTENVRRNKRQIITKANRPSALRGKNTFVIKTSKGDVLFQRVKRYGKHQGPTLKGGVTRRRTRLGGSDLVALYNLEPKARIRKQSTFFAPITKVVSRRGRANIEREIARALATMR